MRRARGIVGIASLSLLLLLPACAPDASPPLDIPSWAKVAPEQIAEARKYGVPVAFENDLGMRFVLIPAGTFLMGSPEDEEGRGAYETQHEVTLTKPFYMSIYEVTNGLYRRSKIGHEPPEGFDGDLQPAVMLCYDDAIAFSLWASGRESSRQYRLPSEAEWEYACRAGTTTAFWSGDGEHALYGVGWYIGSSRHRLPPGATRSKDDRIGGQLEPRSHAVGTKRASPWGLYDMHGNVYEWCDDAWVSSNQDAPSDGSAAFSDRSGARMVRGGSWATGARFARSAARGGYEPEFRAAYVGFRLVSPLPEKDE